MKIGVLVVGEQAGLEKTRVFLETQPSGFFLFGILGFLVFGFFLGFFGFFYIFAQKREFLGIFQFWVHPDFKLLSLLLINLFLLIYASTLD